MCYSWIRYLLWPLPHNRKIPRPQKIPTTSGQIPQKDHRKSKQPVLVHALPSVHTDGAKCLCEYVSTDIRNADLVLCCRNFSGTDTCQCHTHKNWDGSCDFWSNKGCDEDVRAFDFAIGMCAGANFLYKETCSRWQRWRNNSWFPDSRKQAKNRMILN